MQLTRAEKNTIYKLVSAEIFKCSDKNKIYNDCRKCPNRDSCTYRAIKRKIACSLSHDLAGEQK